MTAQHAEAVAALMLSRDDWMPPLPIWTGTLRSIPGPGGGSYVPCDTCASSGRMRGAGPCIVCRDRRKAGEEIRRPRHGCTLCMACDGVGELRRRVGEDRWDAYVGMRLSDARELAQREQAERLNYKRALLEAVEEEKGYRWERDQDALHRAGSYADLERQLGWLADKYPRRYSQVMHWARLGGHDHQRRARSDLAFAWSLIAVLEIAGTLELLGERMEKPIRVPRWARRRVAA